MSCVLAVLHLPSGQPSSLLPHPSQCALLTDLFHCLVLERRCPLQLTADPLLFAHPSLPDHSHMAARIPFYVCPVNFSISISSLVGSPEFRLCIMDLMALSQTFKNCEILHKNFIKKCENPALLPMRQQKAGVEEQLFALLHLSSHHPL